MLIVSTLADDGLVGDRSPMVFNSSLHPTITTDASAIAML
jgi:hypothetical protein